MDKELSHKVCRLIAGIVVSDDDLDATEDAFIDRMLTRFGIPLDERETIFPIIERDEAVATMRELPGNVQQEALRLLIEAACADGKIAPEEQSYLETVAQEIGIAADELKKRLDAALAAHGG